MKQLLLICIILCAGALHAATWYADSGTANASAITWHATSGGNCVTGSGATLAWGSGTSTDVFDSNGCSAIAITTEPGSGWSGASAGVCGTGGTTPTIQTNTTNGGGFTYATATNIITHMNVTATKSPALVVSGTSGGGTICGYITGGSVASAYGVSTTHGTVALYIIGGITGGTTSSTYGYYSVSGNGLTTIIGNVTAGSGSGSSYGMNLVGTGATTIIGNCIGSNTTAATGCNTGTSTITLTGSLINGLKGLGALTPVLFTPSATSYILYPKDASYTLGVVNSHATVVPADPGAANVRSGTVYGPFTGTMSSTGAVSSESSW